MSSFWRQKGILKTKRQHKEIETFGIFGFRWLPDCSGAKCHFFSVCAGHTYNDQTLQKYLSNMLESEARFCNYVFHFMARGQYIGTLCKVVPGHPEIESCELSWVKFSKLMLDVVILYVSYEFTCRPSCPARDMANFLTLAICLHYAKDSYFRFGDASSGSIKEPWSIPEKSCQTVWILQISIRRIGLILMCSFKKDRNVSAKVFPGISYCRIIASLIQEDQLAMCLMRTGQMCHVALYCKSTALPESLPPVMTSIAPKIVHLSPDKLLCLLDCWIAISVE